MEMQVETPVENHWPFYLCGLDDLEEPQRSFFMLFNQCAEESRQRRLN